MDLALLSCTGYVLLGEATFSSLSIRPCPQQSPSYIMFRATVPAATVIYRISSFNWPGHKKVRKIADFGHKWDKVLGSGPHTLTQFFWEYPDRDFEPTSKDIQSR